MTQLRPAGPQDIPQIDAFLCDHLVDSVFPLSNLRRFGLAGDLHPSAMRFWIARADQNITACLGLSNAGYLMPQLPHWSDWSQLPNILHAQQIKGLLGGAQQASVCRAALGLDQTATDLDSTEKQYSLDLRQLTIPTTPCHLVPLSAHNRDIAISWRTAYHIHTMGSPVDAAKDWATRNIDAYLQADSHRILMHHDQPVAMTGFNATLPELVQIGGVYTPPALRGSGYARTAVALHLAQAHRNGVPRAVLAAANPAAERAYEAIGFEQIGHFAMILFSQPKSVPS